MQILFHVWFWTQPTFFKMSSDMFDERNISVALRTGTLPVFSISQHANRSEKNWDSSSVIFTSSIISLFFFLSHTLTLTTEEIISQLQTKQFHSLAKCNEIFVIFYLFSLSIWCVRIIMYTSDIQLLFFPINSTPFFNHSSDAIENHNAQTPDSHTFYLHAQNVHIRCIDKYLINIIFPVFCSFFIWWCFYAIIISTCRFVNWWKLNTFHLFFYLCHTQM